ncbi:MAG: DUF6132 family protein [Cyclobacteriaceae bacterium]|jgi:hypothetical protein|nr:DUF6132 family protein [Cyclobacteriaceae bacterium]
MKTTIIKWSIGITLGAVAGYLYWFYIGCNSGTCAITSSPVNSTLYFGMMGGLVVNMFERHKKPSDEAGKKADS